ncbi:hypothetical protein ACTQ38_17230, partial [Clostridium sp. LCP25S3_F10]
MFFIVKILSKVLGNVLKEMLESKRDGSDKDEGEITGGKRLIKRLYKQYHHFADIIVADAL